MVTRADPGSEQRLPLSRERVLRAAIEVVDSSGIESLTMRRLAEELGAEAMSLYHYVANKEDLLDGITDTVVAEINEAVAALDGPSAGASWKTAVRRRILAAREVMLRHRWAPGVMETRTSTGLAVLLYLDGLVRLMRDGGFSNDVIHHAMHALGSRALGFSQELFDPSGASDEDSSAALASMASQIPHLVAMYMEVAHDDPGSTLGWCDDQTEFEFGLDLLLNGLDKMRSDAGLGGAHRTYTGVLALPRGARTPVARSRPGRPTSRQQPQISGGRPGVPLLVVAVKPAPRE